MQLRNLSVLALASACHLASAQITFTPHTTGLSRPVTVGAPKGDSRLFIVEQRQSTTGRIRLVSSTGAIISTFLSVTGLATGNEQGLLGIAFHPNYATNGFFYVNYTISAGGHTRIVRYKASGADPMTATTADPASATPIISINQDFSNHNGGSLKFGPDGFLYIGMGDGGSGNDPNNRAQSLNSLLGKFLRLDVDRDDFPVDTNKNYGIPATNPFAVSGGLPEIWSYGWRNPWQFTNDDPTLGGFGGWFVADVGQISWEEVSYERPGAPAGLNYGWRVKEGFSVTGNGGGTGPFVDPIYVYDRDTGFSISGGTLYRGVKLGPENYGRYFFCDFVMGKLWSLKITFDAQFNATASDFQEHVTMGQTSCIMPDADGELYGGTIGSVLNRFEGTGVEVTGRVVFSDLVTAANRPRRVTLNLKNTDTNTQYDLDLMVKTDGSFRIPAKAGNWELSVKTGQWLRKKTAFTVAAAPVSGVDLVLVNGNANGDGVVDLSDYTIIATAFNAQPADTNWDVRADLNEDGVVDLTDYTIVAISFNGLDD